MAAGPAAPSAGGACEEPGTSGAFEPIVFFLLTYLLSAIAQQIEILSPPSFRVPHSVNLFLSGLALGRLGAWLPETEFGRAVDNFMHVDPHIIFWVLLPALLYEDASSVKWHVMKKVLPSALLLAVPGVIMNALLTGAIIKGSFGTLEWTWDAVFLLGSILSATDPVAVVGALHELAAPAQLSLLISGESLFNDGSAVVIFYLFWDSARGIRSLTPGYSIGFFLRMSCGGPLLGFAFALVAFEWMKQTRKFSIEILVILVSVYGSFFVAEHSAIKVSGVLAVVIFGFFMAARGHFALNIEESHRHHSVIHFLALLSNEAIFVLGGAVTFRVLLAGYTSFVFRDWLELVLLYFVIHGTRALILALCFPLLKRWGYGLSVKEAAVCLFGGLRGAVGLALALMVEHDSRLDDATRARIAFHTSGIVLATLLVNGTLITTFYRRLQVYTKAQYHEKLLRMALMKADSLTQRRGVMFEQHWFFHNCFFNELFEALPDLMQAAGELDRQTLGKSTAEPSKWSMPIHETMGKIAQRLGDLDKNAQLDRYMQKLRFRRRWARSGSNVFIPVTLVHADEDEQTQNVVMELAMRMANIHFKEAEGSEDEDAMSTSPSPMPSEAAHTEEAAHAEDGPPSPRVLPPDQRRTELKPAAAPAALKPMVAWCDDRDGGQKVTPSSRPRSRVHFLDSEEDGEAPAGRVPSTASAASRARSSAPRMTDPTAGGLRPSLMGEMDQRLLYRHLQEQSLMKREQRLRSKTSVRVPEVSAEGSMAEAAPRRTAPTMTARSRTGLQAQRVEALFSDHSIQNIGSAITMAVMSKDLRAASEGNDTSAKARIRWKIAKMRVQWALRTIQSAMGEHKKLVEGADKGARLNMQRSKSLCSERLLDDSASMVDMYHMILNAFRCTYKEMYEARSLPEGPFRVLMESLELQEEAVDGELKTAPVAPSDPALDAKLRRLPTSTHQDQMDHNFVVAWQYIAEVKNRSWDKGRLDCLHNGLFRLPVWWQMKHDIVMMLGFIMTIESIAEEMEVIQNFEDMVKRPMLQVTEKARATALYQVMIGNPAMFFLFEHVLCLRLMLDFQTHLCKDLQEDGLLAEEDADSLIKKVIQPAMVALENYVPTREHLRMASRQGHALGWRTKSLANSQRVHPESSPGEPCPGDGQPGSQRTQSEHSVSKHSEDQRAWSKQSVSKRSDPESRPTAAVW